MFWLHLFGFLFNCGRCRSSGHWRQWPLQHHQQQQSRKRRGRSHVIYTYDTNASNAPATLPTSSSTRSTSNNSFNQCSPSSVTTAPSTILTNDTTTQAPSLANNATLEPIRTIAPTVMSLPDPTPNVTRNVTLPVWLWNVVIPTRIPTLPTCFWRASLMLLVRICVLQRYRGTGTQ